MEVIMKRVIFGLAIVLTLFGAVSCNTVTSSMAYAQPVAVAETGIFTAKAGTYLNAWIEAVTIGKERGFTKVISETTENSIVFFIFNQVQVTVVMTKEDGSGTARDSDTTSGTE